MDKEHDFPMNGQIPAARPLPQTPVSTQFQKLWGSFQHEMLYITWGTMDVALLAPFALSLMAWARYWPPALVAIWLLLVMLIPFNLARLMTAVQVPRKRQQTVMAVSLLVMLFLSLRTMLYQPDSLLDFSWISSFFSNAADADSLQWMRDAGVIFLTLFAWFRGMRLVSQDFGLNRAGTRLRVGSLILAPLVVFMGNTLTWDVTPFVLLFFLAALTAVALIRVEDLEKSQSGLSASKGPRWLGAVVSASLATILTAGFIGGLISGRPSQVLAGWLAPFWLALRFGATAVLQTVSYLATPFLELLAVFIDWMSRIMTRIFSIVPADFALETPPPASEILGTPAPDAVIEPVTIAGLPGGRLIALLLILALVLIVSLTLTRLYRQAALADQEGEFGRPAGGQRAQTAGLGRRLWNQFGRLRNWRAAASIRRIYQQMCQAAAANGYPRDRSDTPYEYQPVLERVWPDLQKEIQLITNAYVRVRYGEIPETKAEMDEISQAWQQLKQTKPDTAVSLGDAG